MEQPDKAIAVLRRAAKISGSDEVQPLDRGDVQLLLAKTLWSAGKHDESRAAGTAAVAAFEAAGPDLADDTDAASAWLATHE